MDIDAYTEALGKQYFVPVCRGFNAQPENEDIVEYLPPVTNIRKAAAILIWRLETDDYAETAWIEDRDGNIIATVEAILEMIDND